MAGDWFKMRTDLDETPEVIGMAARLGIEEDKVIALCYRLWRWADRQCLIDNETFDAHANGLPTDWIDRHVRFDGFADALRTFGWLKAKKGGFILPNAGRWLGENAKARAVSSQKKRIQRTSAVPKSVLKNRGQKQGPEKRREEKSNDAAHHLPPSGGESKKSRKPDHIWDAVVAECGDPRTTSERGKFNKAVKELKEAGATPDAIRDKAKLYRDRYPRAALTPNALAGHWGQLGHDGAAETRPATDAEADAIFADEGDPDDVWPFQEGGG